MNNYSVKACIVDLNWTNSSVSFLSNARWAITSSCNLFFYLILENEKENNHFILYFYPLISLGTRDNKLAYLSLSLPNISPLSLHSTVTWRITSWKTIL